MASFDITLDLACKGKPEDIANMKKRLAAIRSNPDKINDPQWLRDLFEDELGEIICPSTEEPLDVDDEAWQMNDTFEPLLYAWDDSDIDDLQFSGASPYEDEPAGYVNAFAGALIAVFPRLKFHAIAWHYVSWGGYTIYDGADEAWSWDEANGGAANKDIFVEWQHAYRALWLLPDDAPEAARAEAKKALKEASAAWDAIPED